MEQISLEKRKQKKLQQKVTKIKEKLQAGNIKLNESSKKRKKTPREVNNKGAIYIGHVPHGFYEYEMASFFKQFGTVTRVKLGRSKRTGRSRGFAFVEFAYAEVAKIAAEAMDNRLLCNSILKCKFIPPEEITPKMFLSTIDKNNYPRLENRKKEVQNKNRVRTKEEEKKRITKSQEKLKKVKGLLKDKGIKFSFRAIKF